MRLSSTGLLVASLALVFAVAAVGGLASASGLRDWYDSLEKAPWNPPDWVFGPAWTFLYALMAVAAWLVARTGLDKTSVRTALVLYVTQLALNLAWSLLFFAARSPGWALVDIVVLDVLVAVTLLAFWRIEPVAGCLLLPYLAWIVFATSLNTWVVMRN
ncbi:MAG TPA: TspO/MBR family protein [Gaiella sp.]|nr:TspO/MBR family protein [Gaiella sp.]